MASFKDLLGRLTGRPAAAPHLELPRVPTADEIVATVDSITADIAAKGHEGRVPQIVVARVTKIAGTVRDLVPRLDQLGSGSQDAYVVTATATSYLPEALGAYLRLPRSYADRRPVDGAKTSLLVLVDQLDLLAAKMDDMLDAAYRSDAAALVAHGRFLADKFARSGLDVGGGSGGAGGLPGIGTG